MALFVGVFEKGNVSNDDLSQFYSKTAESHFLFGHEISDYLTDIKKKVSRLMHLNKMLETAPISERKKLVEKESELVAWFRNQFDETIKLFTKYLSFEAI